MKTRKIAGKLESTVLGFGGGSVSGSAGGYGYGDISEGDAIEVLQYAYQKGVRLFDTAPIYGFGESERRIGKALTGDKKIRKELVVVTKTGVTWDEPSREARVDNSPAVVERMLERSLKDLQTDYIDVYMIHWPDALTPIENTMETLKKYKKAGIIRAIGASNFGVDLYRRACAVEQIDTLQSEFNVLNNTNAAQLFELVQQEKLGFMAYGTLAKGILSGRVAAGRKFDASDFRSKVSFVEKQRALLEGEVAQFTHLAQELRVSPAALATAYVLSFSEVATALCGMKTKAQVDDLCTAFEIPLETKLQLDAMAKRSTPLYLKCYEED